MKTVMLVEDEELILEGLHAIIDWEELGMQVVYIWRIMDRRRFPCLRKSL